MSARTEIISNINLKVYLFFSHKKYILKINFATVYNKIYLNVTGINEVIKYVYIFRRLAIDILYYDCKIFSNPT